MNFLPAVHQNPVKSPDGARYLDNFDRLRELQGTKSSCLDTDSYLHSTSTKTVALRIMY